MFNDGNIPTDLALHSGKRFYSPEIDAGLEEVPIDDDRSAEEYDAEDEDDGFHEVTYAGSGSGNVELEGEKVDIELDHFVGQERKR